MRNTQGFPPDPKFFKGCAHRTSAVCTILAALSMLAFWLSPKDSAFLTISLIILSAFFIYGPQALLGIACTNQATKRAAATANGLNGLFGYLAPIVSGVVFGVIADKSGWDMIFLLSVIMGVIGAILLATLWKQPATAYGRLEKITEECRKENP